MKRERQRRNAPNDSSLYNESVMLLPEEIPEEEVAQLLSVDQSSIERLPAGGQKQVFLIDTGTDKFVAKFVQVTYRTVGTASFTRQNEYAIRTERELDLMRNYSSPYLPVLTEHVYESAFVYNNAEFIVFSEQYVGSMSVRKIVEGGTASESDVKKLLVDVARAIDVYWTNGKIVHRDIKPDNIIRADDDGRYVLIDGGIHYSAQNASITGGIIGTAPYLSPEQILGERKELDSRSDMYSLGLVAYELLTGSHPYFDLASVEGMQVDELRDIIVNTKPKAFEEYEGLSVDDGLAAIIGSLLSKRKFYRPRNPQKLVGTVEELA